MPATPDALLLASDGGLQVIDLPASSDDHLIVMRAVLRCQRVDLVALTSHLDMWVDDEFLYNYPDEINPFATLLARRYGFTHQPYHGPVLLTGGADQDGETLPLTLDRARALLAALHDTAS
ncbi:DUF3846 domain-containing protein [Streptomyces sp. N2-109]|uniref:DUF3846 domain-containing protein n=1 Tax=Streptomyces gossypii TaxID=2883101 RepID=A0ABT2JTG4_9ACTN|nr:DUF3846 domain-containing protein [Streptomyces gossypii]MCT2591136.1 DUF3846 domain-containing protein [Streptomyces gossypii]